MLSVVFITKNEARHIAAAIENVREIASEIFVVDSGSTDGTVQIAEKSGATVFQHPFDGFGAQWNWALENCPIKTPWTMKMDPDERLTSMLKSEIIFMLADQTSSSEVERLSAFSFDRILWFMGHRLSGVRNEVVRVWRTGQCRFSDVSVNEHPIVAGHCAKLRGTMDHFDSPDLAHWLAKQNDYTTREARMRLNGDKLAAEPRLWGTSLERRMWLKQVFYHIPCRYLIHNIILFFLRGAWRSGVWGWRWVKCREIVMRLREYKYLEMRG